MVRPEVSSEVVRNLGEFVFLTDSGLRFPNQPLIDVFKKGRDVGRKVGISGCSSVHFAMSFLCCLDDLLKIQAD